jgi:cyanobactin maturation PatA/PatG family protease
LVLPIFFGTQAENRVRPASQLDLARAISFALEQDVSIINVSAGQKAASLEAETHLAQAVQRCAEERVLLVAAAGNDGCPCIHLPAVVASVLAVGALDEHGHPVETSNWGEAYRNNGLLAPGKNLSVAAPRGAARTVSGTSFATAVVSGVAALLLSIARREGYQIDPIDVRDILIDSATRCELQGEGSCDRYLAGTLNAVAALAMLHGIGTASRSMATRSAATPALAPSGTSHYDQFIPSVRGDVAMLDATLEQSEAAVVGTLGVSPSACSCEKKVEDEEKRTVRPQGVDLRPRPVEPPTIPLSLNRPADGISQQGCGCGGGQPPQLVYALGSLWFDFGTEARYDAIVQQLGDPVRANNPTELFGFLRSNPQFVSGITFILMQDQIPLYAIQPAGPFALQTYTTMLDALDSSITDRGREQRVSLPGYISGSTRLMNGMTVPVVFPDLRGMYMWRAEQLVEATAALAVGPPAPPADEAVLNFLNRVYYELRNLGVAPQERAINFAATNAYQSRQAFAEAAAGNYALDSIKVVKSPICRPDSDCWDVQLQMFDPENERRAGRVYRYTVDVSEVLPVTVGPVRSWAVRLGAQ